MHFQNEFHVLTICWMRVDLPHESLQDFSMCLLVTKLCFWWRSHETLSL